MPNRILVNMLSLTGLVKEKKNSFVSPVKSQQNLSILTKQILVFLFVFLSTALLYPSSVESAEPEVNNDNIFFETKGGVRAYDVKPQPLISLTFDDGKQSVYDTAYPILNGDNIPATIYFPTQELTDQWRSQLLFLENQGWEIASHTVHHLELPTLSQEELITELSQSKSDLESVGLTVHGFAYPGGSGSTDGDILRQVKNYYSYARSVSLGYNEPIIKKYALRTQNQVVGDSIATMKGWVDTAISNNQWLVIVMHRVDDSGNTYSITPENLTELSNYIKTKIDAGNIAAVTVNEGVTRYEKTYWEPIYDTSYSIQEKLAVTNGRILWLFGSDIVDYQHDGYEWLENGKVEYWEWNGSYHKAGIPSNISLQTYSPDQASVQFTLTDVTDGNFSVTSATTFTRGSSLAEVTITSIDGTATSLSLSKGMTRRFSTNEDRVVLDGLIEIGGKTYGNSAQGNFAFDTTNNLIRILAHLKQKSFNEYSDYTNGEFRSVSISKATDLPYTWFVGGIILDTGNLLEEAEDGSLGGSPTYYTGTDASPKSGNTGVVLDSAGESVSVEITPPVQANYTLVVRQKGGTVSDQYSYQIDGGSTETKTVTGTTFGYENIDLSDLSSESHTVILNHVAGSVTIDYILLSPVSRTANTPLTAELPLDVSRQALVDYDFNSNWELAGSITEDSTNFNIPLRATITPSNRTNFWSYVGTDYIMIALPEDTIHSYGNTISRGGESTVSIYSPTDLISGNSYNIQASLQVPKNLTRTNNYDLLSFVSGGNLYWLSNITREVTFSLPANTVYGTDYNQTVFPSGSVLLTTNLSPESRELPWRMSITPSSDSIEVIVDTWNTSGDYYKKWRETATVSNIRTNHTLGDLKPNTTYLIKVDSSPIQILTSDSTGSISFNYNGGYSTRTFEIEESPELAPTGGQIYPIIVLGALIIYAFICLSYTFSQKFKTPT